MKYLNFDVLYTDAIEESTEFDGYNAIEGENLEDIKIEFVKNE